MAKKKDEELAIEAEKLKAELEQLKETKKKLDEKTKTKKTAKKEPKKPKKEAKKEETKTKKTAKKEPKKSKKEAKKEETKTKKTAKKEEKKVKLTKKQERELAAKKEAEEQRTLEEELEEQLTDAEIENFQIEKVDMEKLTNRVCEMLAKYESNGMFQSELWKKLKLSSRDGSRLALKLERTGIINREKLLEKGRWTYKLILKKTPISTQSIENAPCLICPVEQKCSLDGEISPRTCQWIDEWVTADLKKPKVSQ
ncbi:MAG: transcriptional regulator [Crenarchaeota archaeon]|nr:MAG: transcriptional regulator [Thermoproteota archaeon]